MRHDKDNVFAEFSDWLDMYYNGIRRRECLSAHEQAVAQDAWNAGWESGHHEGHVDGYRLAEAGVIALRKDLDDALSDLDSAREEIERLRRENLTFRAAQKACELCGPNSPVWIDGKPANVEAEVVALRTDLDDALDVLRHLRRLQKDVHEPEETIDEWWDQVLRAGRDADTVLARFDIKTTE